MKTLQRTLHRAPKASADRPLWLQLKAEDLPPPEDNKHIIQPYDDQTALEILVWNAYEFGHTLDRALGRSESAYSYKETGVAIRAFFHDIASMLQASRDKALSSKTPYAKFRREQLLDGLNSIADTQRGLRPAVSRIRTRLTTMMGDKPVDEDRLRTQPGDWFENAEYGITTCDTKGATYVWTKAKPNDKVPEPLARKTSTSLLYSWQPSTSPTQADCMSRVTWDSRGDWAAVTRPVVTELVGPKLNESLQANLRAKPSDAYDIAQALFSAMGVDRSEEELSSAVASSDDSATLLSWDVWDDSAIVLSVDAPPEDSDSSGLLNERALLCIQTCTMTSALTPNPSSTSPQ